MMGNSRLVMPLECFVSTKVQVRYKLVRLVRLSWYVTYRYIHGC